MAPRLDLFMIGLLLVAVSSSVDAQYLGKRIGALSELQHGVKGEVFAVDSRTIHVKGFSYDGAAPDAFFYGGFSGRPSDEGFIIPDENGSTQPLKRYRNKDVTLTLPEGITLKDVKWISVWCRAFAIDFGHVVVPSGLQYPRPQKINALSTLDHGVSSDRLVVVDAQTFLIPNFSYDGAAPDARFWVGRGDKPGSDGTVVPDENGSTNPLKRYEGKTIVITLPDHLTVFDIDYLSVWCKAFFADFGNVRIPATLNVPPSLKMLGVAPQTKLNCEVLYDDLALEVRWAVAGESIVMQLVGRVADSEYMSFGVSGSDTRSVMIGGDVVTAWLERDTGRGFAEDYFLGAKAQCQGGRGSCPDTDSRGSNDVRLLNAALINDFTMLTFQRPLRATDATDRPIYTNNSQAVIWAVGPVNAQGHTSYHTLRTRGDMFVDFGRTPRWNCPLPDEPVTPTPSAAQARQPATTPVASNVPQAVTPSPNAWYIPPIPCYEPEDGVFYAQIGPTAGENGYNAITGHVGWGVAFYINGLLIPEIHVVRGKSYTFVVEGGYDEANPSRSHPLYITDDPEGGYEHKSPQERAQVKVFAGVDFDANGNPTPTSFGRLCEWKANPDQPSDAFTSFGAFQRTLNLDCKEGQPGILQWTPDANTPDTVYYQCFSHRYLGWKIHVHDTCDAAAQRSSLDYGDDYHTEDQSELATGSSNTRQTVIDLSTAGFVSRRKTINNRENEDLESPLHPQTKKFASRSDQSIFSDTNNRRSGFSRGGGLGRGDDARNSVDEFRGDSLSRTVVPQNEGPRSWSEANIRFDFPKDFGKKLPELKINSLEESSLPEGDETGFVLKEHKPPGPPPPSKYAITNEYNYVDVTKNLREEVLDSNLRVRPTDFPKMVGEVALSITKPPTSAAPTSFAHDFESTRLRVSKPSSIQDARDGVIDRRRPFHDETERGYRNDLSKNNPSNHDYENHNRDVETPVPVKINSRVHGNRQRTPQKHNFVNRHNEEKKQYEDDRPGFKPESVVFESDFVPILTEDSPGPPRALLEFQQSRDSSRGSNHERFQEHHLPPRYFEGNFDIEDRPITSLSHFHPDSLEIPHFTKGTRIIRNQSSNQLREVHTGEINFEPDHGLPHPSSETIRPANIFKSEAIILPDFSRHGLKPDNPNLALFSSERRPTHNIRPTATHVFSSGKPIGQGQIINSLAPTSALQSHFQGPLPFENESPGLFQLPHHLQDTHQLVHVHTSIHRATPLHISPDERASLNPQVLREESLHVNELRGPNVIGSILSNNVGADGHGISSHFKGPQDPPQTFSVHHVPIDSANSLVPGTSFPQLQSFPFSHPVPPSGVLPPPVQLVPGTRPFRNRRPHLPGQRPRHHSNQNGPRRIVGDRLNPRITNFGENLHGPVRPGQERFHRNRTAASQRIRGPLIHDNRRLGQQLAPQVVIEGEKPELLAAGKERISAKRRASTATKTGESFLQNIWSTLTGGSRDEGNAPQPTPRLVT
ncbi:uncharacterized protein LOC108665610 [Hyalella azteca]|uniref:Uncharacterized protein LOC108665610 n=1 Tax=Hyalella azteca TaxID=294128 RepID=A0A8B7N2S2_HYAAZ|nr:uncharacterized protein LOC108665610 [Hyalella azteca]